MKTLRFLSGAIALAGLAPACSSTHAPAPSDGNLVTVTTGAPPALIAFRDELSTDWIGLPIQHATTFDLTTHGAYQVVVACSAGDQDPDVSIILYGRTPDDDPMIESTCATVATFDVQGVMLQAGEVALGNTSEGTTGTNWRFDLPARSGTFDLVLVSLTSAGVPSGVAFRRDMAIVNDEDLGTIDLTAEADQSLIPVPFTVANLQVGETVSSSALLVVGNTRVPLTSLSALPPGPTAHLAPDSALRPTDRQHVTLSASVTDAATSLTRSRALGRDVRVGDPTSWTLPDPIGPVMFESTADRLTATWSTLPDHDEIELLRESVRFQPTQFQTHELLLSRSFLEATGATSATLDFHAIPGFKRQWQQDPASSQFHELVAIRHVSATEIASATASSNTSASAVRGELPASPGAGRRATWFVPGRPDRWFTIPRSPGLRGLEGRP